MYKNFAIKSNFLSNKIVVDSANQNICKAVDLVSSLNTPLYYENLTFFYRVKSDMKEDFYDRLNFKKEYPEDDEENIEKNEEASCINKLPKDIGMLNPHTKHQVTQRQFDSSCTSTVEKQSKISEEEDFNDNKFVDSKENSEYNNSESSETDSSQSQEEESINEDEDSEDDLIDEEESEEEKEFKIEDNMTPIINQKFQDFYKSKDLLMEDDNLHNKPNLDIRNRQAREVSIFSYIYLYICLTK